MPRLKILSLPAVLGLAVALAAPAGAQTAVPAAGAAKNAAFELDPKATRVAFTLGATMHTVHGTIRAERGSLRIDPATGTGTGEIVLDAASAQTGNAARDKDMHQKVLETAKHPEIVWRIDRVEGFPRDGAARSARITLTGSLAIHGASHPLTVPAELTLSGDKATATAALKIPYVAWGMADPSSFVLRVDKEVAVEVHAVGRLGG